MCLETVLSTYQQDSRLPCKHSFLRELNQLIKIRHRNIVEVICCIRLQGRLSIVMKFANCGTVLKQIKNVSIDIKHQWSIDIARGLNYGYKFLKKVKTLNLSLIHI